MSVPKTEAVIRDYNGRPTVFVNGQPQPLPGFNASSRPGIYERASEFFYAHKMGVYIIQPRVERFWQGADIHLDPLPSQLSGGWDVEEQAEAVLAGDPDAYLMVRFTPHPPVSWKEAFPQELFITEDGTTVGSSASMASTLFWDTMARASAAIIAWIEKQPWADRVIGYTNFQVTEGTHIPVDRGYLFDHNPQMVAQWRRFLQARYASQDDLRAAHDDPTVTFESVDVPRDRLRGAMPEVTDILYWQSAVGNQPLRDYLELQRDLWHRNFRQVSAAMDEVLERKVIILHDALKLTQQGWNLGAFFDLDPSWSPAYPEVMAGSGHMNVTELFNIPGCDGLMTPLDYQARGIGGVCQTEGIADSLVLRGGYYYGEMDQRTSPVGDGEFGTPRTYDEFAAVSWRNFADAWSRGYNSYWFDIGGGYYDTPEFHQIIGRQVEVIKQSIDWQHETMPGIAMILDDSSVLETNGAGNYMSDAVMWEQKLGLARCGVPYRVYLLEDLALDQFPDHRVFYFPNLFKVDERRLEILRERVFRDGHVVVWGPGSGISNGTDLSVDSVQDLTGFEMRMVEANSPRRVAITNYDHPAVAGLPPGIVYGGSMSYGPLLFPQDGDELGLAWTKWACNEMGLAIKSLGRGAGHPAGADDRRGPGDWASVFSVAAQLPADLWRSLARYAGAHVYCEENEVIMADSSVVALHSVKSGSKHLSLPGQYHVRDLVRDRDVVPDCDGIDFELHGPETAVFQLQAVEK
mgnify:CR=1 FL=1